MKKYYRLISQITSFGFFLVTAFAISSFRDAIPNQIYVVKDEEISYEFHVPVSVVLKEDGAEVFENLVRMEQEEKSYTVTCKLFGIFPVKDVQVMLVDSDSVHTSGMPIGIYARTDGVLIIGTGAVTDETGRDCMPAENRVRSGDYIVSVNGEQVFRKEELVDKINAYGDKREILGIQRDGEYIEVSLTPVRSSGGTYMLGIWVRDDLAGVGTMTYYRDNGEFGALGHAISDGDTGTLMQMSEGWIYTADIIGIRKGEKGTPGELSGVIDYTSRNCLGSITENTPLGIRGMLNGNQTALSGGNNYEVAYKQDIRLGTAYIESSLSGTDKRYEIQIESLDYSGNEQNKGILFRVTDKELLDTTGGIVQGMSGSPIVQNGKIIGAVTHVFVSDATMGYGIFIEKMLR